jgi:hypothetical protein
MSVYEFPPNQNRHSGPDFHRDKLQPESRATGENRDPVFEGVPDWSSPRT